MENGSGFPTDMFSVGGLYQGQDPLMIRYITAMGDYPETDEQPNQVFIQYLEFCKRRNGLEWVRGEFTPRGDRIGKTHGVYGHITQQGFSEWVAAVAPLSDIKYVRAVIAYQEIGNVQSGR